jgi:hypothetical protein
MNAMDFEYKQRFVESCQTHKYAAVKIRIIFLKISFMVTSPPTKSAKTPMAFRPEFVCYWLLVQLESAGFDASSFHSFPQENFPIVWRRREIFLAKQDHESFPQNQSMSPGEPLTSVRVPNYLLRSSSALYSEGWATMNIRCSRP